MDDRAKLAIAQSDDLNAKAFVAELVFTGIFALHFEVMAAFLGIKDSSRGSQCRQSRQCECK